MDKNDDGDIIGGISSEAIDRQTMLHGINWGLVLKRLSVSVYARSHSLLSTSADVEDIVQNAFKEFMASENYLGFDPRRIPAEVSLEEGLTRFLTTVAGRRTLDQQRKIARRRACSLDLEDAGTRDGDDSGGLTRPELRTREIDSPEYKARITDFQRYLISLVPGDEIAIAVIILAAAAIKGKPLKNQQLAEQICGDHRKAVLAYSGRSGPPIPVTSGPLIPVGSGPPFRWDVGPL